MLQSTDLDYAISVLVNLFLKICSILFVYIILFR